MIDYFALLEQPRGPWLDLEQLRDIYHRKTLAQHPDSQAHREMIAPVGVGFADLNEAYRVLRDPKLRLQHLLRLEGCALGSADQTIPRELHDLFPTIGALTQRNKLLLKEVGATSSPLSRALLKSRILTAQNETNEMRQTLRNLTDTALTRLRQVHAAWLENPSEQISALSNLNSVFAFLNRWSSQLDEMHFQLSLH